MSNSPRFRTVRRFDTGAPEVFPYEDAVRYKENQHPFCSKLPVAAKADINSLMESLYRDGQVDPVVFWRESRDSDEIYLVDGRHRVFLLSSVGIEFHSIIYTCPENDIISWIWAKNGARRQMDALTRGEMELAFLERIGKDFIPGTGARSSAAQAVTLVRDKATPELRSLVDDRRMSLTVAKHAATTLSPHGQRMLAKALIDDPEMSPRAALKEISLDPAMLASGRRPRKTTPIAVFIHVELPEVEALSRYDTPQIRDIEERMLAELGPTILGIKAKGFRVTQGVATPRNL